MARREPVTMYFSEEEKEAIEKEAAAEDKSVSTYCRDIVQSHRFDRTADDIGAEERLERLVAEGTEQLETIAEDVREQNGLVIHLLREIETQLEGVDLDAADRDGDRVDEPGGDLEDRLRGGDR